MTAPRTRTPASSTLSIPGRVTGALEPASRILLRNREALWFERKPRRIAEVSPRFLSSLCFSACGSATKFWRFGERCLLTRRSFECRAGVLAGTRWSTEDRRAAPGTGVGEYSPHSLRFFGRRLCGPPQPSGTQGGDAVV